MPYWEHWSPRRYHFPVMRLTLQLISRTAGSAEPDVIEGLRAFGYVKAEPR